MTLFTVGHGTDDRHRLGTRLLETQIRVVIDVRRFPGSRRHPDVTRDALASWLPEIGVRYRWEERLGGRRRLPAGEPVADGWWKVTQFAAYAAHTRTPDFVAALGEVLEAAESEPVAVMCSEFLWWRCHRRLIADVTMLSHQVAVQHLMPDGKLVEHQPSEGARLGPDGAVHWPG